MTTDDSLRLSYQTLKPDYAPEAGWGDVATDVLFRAPINSTLDLVQGVGQFADNLTGRNFDGSWIYDDDLLGESMQERTEIGKFTRNWVMPVATAIVPFTGIARATSAAAKLTRTAGWVGKLAQSESTAAWGARALQSSAGFVEGVTTSGVALTGAAKTASTLTRTFITEAAFSAITTKDNRPHLGDAIASMTGSTEGIAGAFFQAEEDDSWLESRFKHAIEGGVLGTVFDGALMLAGAGLKAGLKKAGVNMDVVDADMGVSPQEILDNPTNAFERGLIGKDLFDKLTTTDFTDPRFAADGPNRTKFLGQLTEAQKGTEAEGSEGAAFGVFDAFAKTMAVSKGTSLDDVYGTLLSEIQTGSVGGAPGGDLFQRHPRLSEAPLEGVESIGLASSGKIKAEDGIELAKMDEATLGKLEKITTDNPDPMESVESAKRFFSQLRPAKSNEALIAPQGLINLLRPGNLAAMLKDPAQFTPEMLAARRSGIENAMAIRKAYASGQATPWTTGSLALWGTFSKQLTPFFHEGGALVALQSPDFEEIVKQLMVGPADEALVKSWYDTTLKALESSPHIQAKQNLGGFVRDFIGKMGKKNKDGKTYFARYHEIMADPGLTGQQKRRLIVQDLPIGHGIKLKVHSLNLLVTGHTDVVILDRQQFRNMWMNQDLNELEAAEKFNYYGGGDMDEGTPDYERAMAPRRKKFEEAHAEWKKAYDRAEKRKPGSGAQMRRRDKEGNLEAYTEPVFDTTPPTYEGLAEEGNPLIPGLALYEGLERSISKRLASEYTAAGLTLDDANVGSFHWDTWNIVSKQAASHGSLDYIIGKTLGREDLMLAAKSVEGRNNALGAGSAWRYYDNKVLFTPFNRTHELTSSEYNLLGKEILKEKNGVIPQSWRARRDAQKALTGVSKLQEPDGSLKKDLFKDEIKHGHWYKSLPEENQRNLEKLLDRVAGSEARDARKRSASQGSPDADVQPEGSPVLAGSAPLYQQTDLTSLEGLTREKLGGVLERVGAMAEEMYAQGGANDRFRDAWRNVNKALSAMSNPEMNSPKYWTEGLPDGYDRNSFMNDLRTMVEANNQFASDSEGLVRPTSLEGLIGTPSDPLGAVRFELDQRAVVRIFQGANKSTALHEFAHIFRRHLASIDPKLAEFAGKAVGAEDPLHWGIDAEETFARDFEKYAMSGEAPTAELKSAFDKFKQWLTDIYSSMRGSPVEGAINKDLKDVFDAMLGKGWNRANPASSLPSPRPGNLPVPLAQELRKSYLEKGGRADHTPSYPHIDVERSKSIADAYDAMVHDPKNPEVIEAYKALKAETLDQYKHLVEKGIKPIPWDSPGEPYASSQAMQEDLAGNRRLFFFRTLSNNAEASFGQTAGEGLDNPLLEKTGEVIKTSTGQDYEMTYNDVFRFVHDIYGHATEGHQFGPRGEEGAWLAHSKMYSRKARRALTTETRGQNSWVNFGSHLRNPDGSLPSKGDPNFVPPQNRRFADQKIGLLPEEFIDHPELIGLDDTKTLSGSISQWLFQGKKGGMDTPSAFEDGIGSHINYSRLSVGEDVVKALQAIEPIAEDLINKQIDDVFSNEDLVDLARVMAVNPEDVITRVKEMGIDGKKDVARFVAAKRFRNSAAANHARVSQQILERQAAGAEITLFEASDFEKSHQALVALDKIVGMAQKTAARITQAGNITTEADDAFVKAISDAIALAADETNPAKAAANDALNAAYKAIGSDLKAGAEAPITDKSPELVKQAAKARRERAPKEPDPKATKALKAEVASRKKIVEAKRAEVEKLRGELAELKREAAALNRGGESMPDRLADAEMNLEAAKQAAENNANTAEEIRTLNEETDQLASQTDRLDERLGEAQADSAAATQAAAGNAAKSTQIGNLKSSTRQANKDTASIANKLASIQAKQQAAQAKLAAANQQFAALNSQYNASLQKLATAVQSVAGLSGQNAKIARVIALANNVLSASQMGTINAARAARLQQQASKAGLLDVFLEHGKASILSGIPTLTTGITSNLANMAAQPIARMAGSAVSLDWKEFRKSAKLLVNVITSGRDMLNLGLINQAGNGPKGFLAVARTIARERGVLLEDNVAEAMGATKAKTFGLSDTSTAGKAVNAYGRFVRAPFTAASAADETFKQMGYLSYLRMKAADAAEAAVWNNPNIPGPQKTTAFAAFVDQYVKDAFDNFGAASRDPATGNLIHEDAAQYAQSLTFQQDLVYGIGKSLQDLKGKHPWLDLVIPFVKTPTNLIRMAVEMTPGLGQLQARKRATEYAKKGISQSKDEVLRSRGLQVMGAAVWASAAYMAASGQITGSGPSNTQERKALMATGWKPYSLISTDENGKVSYIEFRRFDPLSTILGIAADYAEASAYMSDADKDHFAAKAVRSLAENFLSKTYLIGLTEGLKAITQPDQFGAKYLRQRLASFVPNFLARGVQADDEVMREPRTILEAIKARTPLAYQLDPRRNLLGEVITPTPGYLPFMDTDMPGMANYISRVASPAAHSYRVDDAVKSEMAELRYGFSEPTRKFAGADLTALVHPSGNSAYDRLRELSGTLKIGGLTLHERLNKLVTSTQYQRLPMPAEAGDGMNPRVTMIRRVIAAYQGRARTQLTREMPQLLEAKRAEFEAARKGASRSDVVRQILAQQ
jgi:hypothetical protein